MNKMLARYWSAVAILAALSFACASQHTDTAQQEIQK